MVEVRAVSFEQFRGACRTSGRSDPNHQWYGHTARNPCRWWCIL